MSTGDFDLSQWERPARPAWPPAAQWAVGCGSGCALLVLLQGVLLWGIVQVSMTDPPEGLTAQAAAPRTVTAGKSFPVRITLRNGGRRAVTVTNVAVRDTSLSNLTLAKPAPPPRRTLTSFGSTIWGYEKRVEPGQSWTVTVDATAPGPGHAGGSVEFQCGFAVKRAAISVKAEE